MAVVAAMLGTALWPAHVLRGALLLFTMICVIGAFVNLVAEKRRSRYDLRELQRVHEEAELGTIDVPQPEEFDSVRCMCGCVYRAGLAVCPHCKRSQFG